MNFFPFHIGDYAVHTAHLEPMEDLAYRRLLDQYYLREGPLPADVQLTAKLVRMRSMVADVEAVLREFFTLTADGWVNGRADAELVSMQERQKSQRDKANKRWHPPGIPPAVPGHEDVDAAASEMDAAAMPPVPVPVPVPTKEHTHTTLREDWKLPQDWREWAAAECPHWTAEVVIQTAAQFRDHFHAAGKTSADWQATWQKWVRDPLTQRAHKPPKAEPVRAFEPVRDNRANDELRRQAEHAIRAVPPPEGLQALRSRLMRVA